MTEAAPRVSVLDARAVVAEAGRLLRAVWAPPTLVYSDSFLAWQFGFPGNIPPLAGAAHAEDGTLVGFAAVTPRRMRLGEWAGTVAALSYVAVAPEHRGRGVAAAVYSVLLDAIAATGAPVLTFGEPGTGGERALLSAYRTAGYRAHRMGACPAFAGLVVREVSEPAATPVSMLAPIASRAIGAPDILWAEPDAAELEHYLRDPRPRRTLSVGETDATALGVAAEMLTARGTETSVLLEQVRCTEDAGSDLRALTVQAASLGTTERVVVSIPNLAGIDPAAARAAGLRRMATRFNAYWCTRPGVHMMHDAELPSGTNSEII